MRTTGLDSLFAVRPSFAVALVLIAHLLSGEQAKPAHETQGGCTMESLPSSVQNRLKEQYGSWKIQNELDLSRSAHERWSSEKPATCPGIATGHFEDAKTVSYATLLIHADHAEGYRLVVFSQEAGKPAYTDRVLESSDNGGAAGYFIHKAPIGKFFDERSRKKFRADMPDGILFLDSGENEYGVDLYFWSSGQYRHEPIDY